MCRARCLGFTFAIPEEAPCTIKQTPQENRMPGKIAKEGLMISGTTGEKTEL